ncbi:MAG: TonB family protein [Blastocatellia bacterium]
MSWHNTLTEWSQRFWPLAINHLWQATLFALLVWAAMLLLQQAPARARHAAWMLAMAKFLLPAALLAAAFDKLGLSFSRTETLATDFSTSALILFETVEPVAQTTAQASHGETYCLLTLVWLAGAIAVCGYWQVRRWRLANALKADSAPASPRVLQCFAESQKRLGLVRSVPLPVSLIVSAGTAEPGVWGILRPTIVLPPGLDERLTDDELAAVLMHELVHINQRDNLFSTVQMVVCSLLWFHPLVWLVDRKLLGECELMCDETVLRSGGKADCYAAGLWKVVQHGLGWPVAGVSRVTGPNLKRRIELMLNTKHQTEKSLLRPLMTGAALCGLLAMAIATAWLTRGKVQAADLPVPEPLQNAVAAILPTEPITGLRISVTPTPTVTPASHDEVSIAQPQEPVTVELPFENAPELPVTITRAKITIVGATQFQSKDHILVDGRETKLEIQIHNPSNRRVTDLAFILTNLPFWGTRDAGAMVKVSESNGSNGTQTNFTITSRMQLEGRSNGLELADHLNNFRLELRGVQFDGEDGMSYVKKDANQNRTLTKMASHWPTPNQLVLNFRRPDSQAPATSSDGQVHQMTASLRPKIIYRERAKYTEEARDQKIEGAVVLSVEFGADGVMRDIKVKKGLPYGLTESAIEAAKAIRFEPAIKDGQPVSVRGNIELGFSLDRSN